MIFTWSLFQSFYKEKFDADEKRVNDLFQNADTHGISVQEKYVSKSSYVCEMKSLLGIEFVLMK